MSEESKTIREHVRDLTRTIGWSLGIILVASGIVHWQREPIIGFLLEPLGNDSTPLQFLSPLDPLFFILKIDFTLGFLATLPIVLLLIWRFIAPATQARLGTGLIMVTTVSVLSLLAAAYAYMVVVPIVLTYMSSIVIAGTTTSFTAHGYLNFLLTTTFLLVAIFQIPLAIIGGTSLGLVTVQQMTERRKYIYAGTLVLAAFITPTTDMVTLGLVTLPAIVVIELGIICARILERRQRPRAKKMPPT